MNSKFPSFDELRRLAENDPQKLEEYRHGEIEKIIATAPPQSRGRLRGLQFQVNCHRQIHGENAMGACIAISRMMHESLLQLQNTIAGVGEERNSQSQREAKVVPFAS